MAGLGSLAKTKATRVLGIDCSTNTLAYAVFDRKVPVRCGEVMFKGDTVYQRLADAHKKIPPLVASGVLKADYIAFEGAFLGPNPQVGLALAYVYGAVMGGLMDAGMEVVSVTPISWQTFIGNPNLKAPEKLLLRQQNPNKSESWYKNAGREMRKQRTLSWARQHFTISTNSDNVGDAVGIAWFAVHKLTTGV